jgi:DNA topoisomerase-1
VTKVAERVRVPAEVTDEICHQCQKNLPAGRQGKLVIRLGKFGKFLSCSRFPECDYTAPYIPKLEGVKCPQCGGEVVIKKTKKGKQFYGCSRWPKCNWASWRKPK